MKKYKLLKWYPGLPNKWKDKEIVINELGRFYYYCKSEKVEGTLKQEEVENNKEYWELINKINLNEKT